MSDWISVEDDLPMKFVGNAVDVWCDGERYIDVDYTRDGRFVRHFNEGCGGVIHCEDEIFPSHWMYPPEPPKE